MKQKYVCPAEMTVALVGTKWRVIVLWNLRKRGMTFNALRKATPGISATNLSKTLRDLGTLGLVAREELGLARGEVRYSTTELGRTLDPVLRALVRWGLEHRERFALGRFVMESEGR
jgi:DNA-binding HxlR family transcriptional regulator